MESFQATVRLSLWLSLLSILFLSGIFCEADDPPFELCSTNTSTYSDNTPFQKSLDNLLQSLRSKARDFKFFNISLGTSEEDKVYGQFMCFNYVSQEFCQSCIVAASKDIVGLCPNAKQAFLWPDDYCQLGYSDRDFSGSLNFSGNILLRNVQNVTEPEKYRATVNETLSNLTQKATNGSAEMYAVGEASFGGDTLYALVQCAIDLSLSECRNCLRRSTREILERFDFSVGARVLSPNCYLRYEQYAFAEGESDTSPTNGKQDRGKKIPRVVSIIAVSACLVIAALFFYACYKLFFNRRKNGNTENQEHKSRRNVDPNDLRPQDSPCVDLLSILAATDGFSESNKLGQGSFGPVYKGMLKGGKKVAVKRLLLCSEQGSDEFTNEVLLIMKLQHKNLVNLLGFCSDRNEKLLVYEYMPNKSLDSILFDPRTRAKLDWKKRTSIIIGIARGILYLHEDSRLQVIHRDLKAGNILLDSDMNPKISDFGIARIFAETDGESSTSTIIGTYGYMAPEYAMEGVYSIKSDVYSFGVLLLEILSGKSINAGLSHTRSTPSLIAYAWHLWQSEQVLEFIDPVIRNTSETEEFRRYLHIGLLCIQEDALDRPTMSSVVVMLKGTDSQTLFPPKRPAFFTGRLSEPRNAVELSCSVNSFTVSDVSPRS